MVVDEPIYKIGDIDRSGGKTVFLLKAECFEKHERKNGGTVLFAVDAQETADGKQTARKILNYQTTDGRELEAFKRGATYTISFETQ